MLKIKSHLGLGLARSASPFRSPLQKAVGTYRSVQQSVSSSQQKELGQLKITSQRYATAQQKADKPVDSYLQYKVGKVNQRIADLVRKKT